MESLRNARALAAALLLLPFVACEDSPTGSSPGGQDPVHLYVGAYELTSVDGGSLPAVVFEGPIDVGEGETALLRVTATGGRLDLGADGRYTLRVEHAVTVDGVPAPGSNWNDRGDYTVGETGLAFVSGHIQNVSFGGIGDGDGITTPQDLAGEGRVVAYRFGRS